MGFIFGIFRFFKMPLQMAIGLYLAFMMLMGTAAGIAYFAEGIDTAIRSKGSQSAPNFLRTLMNEHLSDIVNRLASQITEQEGRDLKRTTEAKAHFLNGIEHLISQL